MQEKGNDLEEVLGWFEVSNLLFKKKLYDLSKEYIEYIYFNFK